MNKGLFLGSNDRQLFSINFKKKVSKTTKCLEIEMHRNITQMFEKIFAQRGHKGVILIILGFER